MAVRVDTSEGVTTVVIDRPDARNAVDRDTAAALLTAFETFDADPEAGVAVLAGAAAASTTDGSMGRRAELRTG